MNPKVHAQADASLHSPSSDRTGQTEPAVGTNRPSYAANFHCIGASCEDHCCQGWSIPVDQETYKKYQQFPAEKLGSTVSQYVTITAADAPSRLYAQINMTPSGECPFFRADRLCGIQKEYGGQLLSATCSIYPRALNQVEGALEGSLMLSCPEAARNILLVPDSTRSVGNLLSGEFRTDNVFYLQRSGTFYKPYSSFQAIRTWLIDMVQDRTRPLWERLLLIGSLCKDLNELTTAEAGEMVPTIMGDYRQILGTTWAKAELDNMPSHPEAKLKIAMRLSYQRAQDASCGPRFLDIYRTFIEGIGFQPGMLPEDDLLRFQEAEETYHRPFFEQRPFIYENYLLNYIFQNLFPFGREGSPHLVQRSIFDEYILMTTQFGWINSLLIGVAGRFKKDFGEEHVVKTFQSFSREAEHDPGILRSIHEFMKAYKLDNLQGMAILLKS
jgi:lysine-N-methylase